MIWTPALWLALLPSALTQAQPESPKFREVTLIGRVVELSTVLKERGLKADAEPIAKQVAIRGDDGPVTPLLSDETSRAFFVDARLRDRRAEIKGRLHEGLPYLQVTSFKVEDQGELRTPEYYCDVCAISVNYPQTCPCCQGPTVFRMKPEAP